MANTSENTREHTFDVGDTVRLNSGGPDMIIVDLVGEHVLYVKWIGAKGKPCEAYYPYVCVTLQNRCERGHPQGVLPKGR